MKVYLATDEWYPVVYYYKREEGDERSDINLLIDVPDKLLKRYDAALAEFSDINDELLKLLEPEQ